MKQILRKPILLIAGLLVILALVIGVIFWFFPPGSRAVTSATGVNRVVYQSGEMYLVVEALTDSLLHLEYTTRSDAPLPGYDHPNDTDGSKN